MPTSPSPEKSSRLSLSPLGWAGVIVAGVLLFAMTALLAAVLAVLQDSRRHIEAQDGKAQLALEQARRSGRAAKPVLREAAPLISEVREAIGPASESAGQISTAAQSLPEILRTGQAVAERSIPVLDALGQSDIATLVHNGNVALATLLYRGRLERLTARGDAVLAEVSRPEFLRDLRRGAQATPRIEKQIQRLVRAQLSALEVLEQSLAVQRETLEAANSLDRKSGGRAPAATPATPATP